jgi:hypothetical protein
MWISGEKRALVRSPFSVNTRERTVKKTAVKKG